VSVLVSYSRKGGVGKTATAVNLAALSAASGARTLVVDLDEQAAATFTFRMKPRVSGGYGRLLRKGTDPLDAVRGSDYADLDVLPSDPSLADVELLLPADGAKDPLGRLLGRLGGHYDRVFVDAPPSSARLARSLLSAADHLVLPTIPTTLSLRTLVQLMKELEGRRRRPLPHPFFCMVDQRKALHRRVIRWEGDHGLGFLRSTVPYSSIIEQMSARRTPVFEYARRSSAAEAYRRLWDEIRERTSSRDFVSPWKKKRRRAVENAVRRNTLLKRND
jgi:cellulose biosynthesis protein BcsQ